MKSSILNLLKKLRLYKPAKIVFSYFPKFGKALDIETIKRTGEVGMPKTIIFEPTFRCNLNCQMCYQKKERGSNKKELTLEQIEDIFVDLKKRIGLKEVTLIGAEIFMRHDLIEVISLLGRLGAKVYLSTNGTLINESNIKQLTKLKNISGFGYSLDGLKPLHNKIRGQNYAFDNLLKTIALTKDKFSLTVNTVIMDENIEYLDEIAKLLKSLGVHNFALQFEMFSTAQELATSGKMLGVASCDFSVEVKENIIYNFSFNKISDKLKAVRSLAGMNVVIQPRMFELYPQDYLNGSTRENLLLSCKYIDTLRINASGEVVFCPIIKKSFGNLLIDSFDKIWNSEDLRNFRKLLLINNLTPVCKRCCRLGLIKQ